MRPTYEYWERKPFLLSGYAGASYGPVPARGPMLNGSSVPAAPSQPNPELSISKGSWEPE